MRHALLALTNPVEGREDDFNAWYDEFHLREVVRYGTGMSAGRRFRLSRTQRAGQVQPPWSYLAWYDFEHQDLADFHRRPWVVDKPPLKPFAGLVADDHAGWTFTPVGERIGPPAGAGRGGGSQPYLFLAFTNPAAGREAEFNAWYDGLHLREVVETLPGFRAGRRWQAPPQQRDFGAPPPWRYLAAYEVEAESAEAVQAAAAGASALTSPSEGVLDPNHVAWLFEPIGEPVQT